MADQPATSPPNPAREPDRNRAGLDPQQGESRLYRLKLGLAVVFPLLVLLGGLLFVHWRRDFPDEIVIAAGAQGGTYYELGQAIAVLIDRELAGVSARALTTDGSNDNRRRLHAGEVPLGFLQNNVQGDDALATVARLYEEVLQIVVWRDGGISQVTDLAGERIALGPRGSGTHLLMQQVLRHYGLEPGDYDPVHASAADSVTSFLAGEVDAAVFFAGLTTPAVAALFAGAQVELLSLGEAVAGPGSVLEGLCRGLPGVKVAVIPAHTYGREPSRPVGTVAVDALLVTRKEAPPHLIHELTRLLFQNRYQLASAHPAALEMEEIHNPRGLRFPLHSGAANYYARNDPPFVLVYAEALSLGLTLVVSVGSGLLAFREWQRRARKNRIDRYYLEVEEVAGERHADRLSREDLIHLREHLVALRNRAFHDLVAERLEANEAFSIFLSAVNDRLLEISQHLARTPRTAAARSGGSP